jgi:N-acetylglucosamine-6-phosphate deacetylase
MAGRLRPPNLGELDELIAAGQGRLRRVNVAPELPDALAFIRHARDRGLTVSIGHSDCSYEQALAAIDAGATVINHTFNAMSGLGHRAPGLVGAALTHEGVIAELILDGAHVHPAAALALYRARGAEGVALITDAIDVAGLPDGVYPRGGRLHTVRDGECRLPDGVLAGSVSTFDRDVRNAQAWLTDDLAALAHLCATTPARAMGIAAHTGALTEGLSADLALLDEDFTVTATIVRGCVVYRREDES